MSEKKSPLIHPILRRGESSILETPCTRVTKFNDYLAELVEEMFATMYAAHGVGLAAPQIGVSLQVAVIDISCGEVPDAKIVLVNPKIMRWDGAQIADEGCLSIPGKTMEKRRYKTVTVRARNAKGKSFALTGTDLLARAIQHEWEHLRGVLLEIPNA